MISYASYMIDTEVVSVANKRECWQKRARRIKAQRFLAEKTTRSFLWGRLIGRDIVFNVNMIRIMGKRQREFDGDNLQSGFKAIRDGIADALGMKDNSPRIHWNYEQKKGDRKCVMVEIRFEYPGRKLYAFESN